MTSRTGAAHAPCDIVVPAYNGYAHLERCLASLERHTPAAHRVVLVDDASTDPRVRPLLEAFAGRRSGTAFLALDANLGFVGAVNTALARTSGDVVLLNADTIVTPGWIEALQRCRASAPRVGIVCPLSNNATLLTIPGLATLFKAGEEDAIAACVARAGAPTYPRIPTAVGFCMLIGREVLDAVGALDPAYGRGYGEENDFSMRALQLGYEIACADDAYVHHAGEASFGEVAGTDEARERNRRLLERRWPGYRQGVSAWMRANPLRPAIERANAEMERERLAGRPRVLQVMHAFDTQGGVEGHTRALIEALRGDVAFNVATPRGGRGRWADFVQERPAPHLRVSRLNEDLITPGIRVLEFPAGVRDAPVERAFGALLEGGYDVVHFQSPLGWNSMRLPSLARATGARVVLSVHDMAWLCAEYNMLSGADARPCGRKVARAESGCAPCLRDKAYSRVGGPGTLSGYIEDRYAEACNAMRDADVVLCPSRFAADRIARAFGEAIAAKVRVIGHGVADLPLSYRPAADKRALTVAFVGRVSPRKGAEHFIELARRLRGERIMFEAWGSIDPTLRGAAAEAGVPLRGPYHLHELADHLRGVDLAMMPSTVEETYCLTLDELHAIGIPVAAARSGAIPERLQGGETGFLHEVGDIDAMRRLLLRLRDDRAPLAHVASRLEARRPKTMQRNAAEYLALYRELAAVARSPAPAALRADSAPALPFPSNAARTATALGDDAYEEWLRAEPRAAAASAESVALVTFTRDHDAASLNRAIARSAAPWVALMEEGDTIAEGALAEIERHARAHPGAAFMYGDHDTQSLRGERYDPVFKPGFSPELLRHQPYIAGLCAVHRERWLAMGGFRAPGWPGVVEFALRLAAEQDPGLVVAVRKLLAHRLDINALALERPVAMRVHQPASTAQVSAYVRCETGGDPAACLDALVARTPGRIAEIFVDVSEAQAVAIVNVAGRRVPLPPVRWLGNRGGAAFAEALNRAASAWLAVVDSRCATFDAGWLERLEQGVTGPYAAAIAPDVLDAAGRRVPAWQVLGGGDESVAGPPPPLDGVDTAAALYGSPREVSCLSPHVSLWRRSAVPSAKVLEDLGKAGRFDIVHLGLLLRERGFDLLSRPIVAAQLRAAAKLGDSPSERNAADVAWMRQRWGRRLEEDPLYRREIRRTRP